MADAGLYYLVVNNSTALPQVVHSSIQPGTDEGRDAAFRQAWELWGNARGRVPFTVAELHLYPMAESKPGQDHAARALELYPPEDGSYPGVDRNEAARVAYLRGREEGTNPGNRGESLSFTDYLDGTDTREEDR